MGEIFPSSLLLEILNLYMQTSKKNQASSAPGLFAPSAVRFTHINGLPPVSTSPSRPARPAFAVELRQLGYSRDGFPIFDRTRSHHHLTDGVLASLIRQVLLEGRDFVKARVEFPRVVGLSDCVLTTAADTIVFAKRENRVGLTRFVLNRSPEPSKSVIGVFKRMVEQPGYLLVTAMVGEVAEPEPWDRNATAESHRFWANHALVWESFQGSSAAGRPVKIGCPGRIGAEQQPQQARAA
jgi:hypothetical protein